MSEGQLQAEIRAMEAKLADQGKGLDDLDQKGGASLKRENKAATKAASKASKAVSEAVHPTILALERASKRRKTEMTDD